MVHLGYRSAFIIRFSVLCAHESYPSNIFQLYNPMWDPNRSETRQPLRVSAVGVPPPATDFHGFPWISRVEPNSGPAKAHHIDHECQWQHVTSIMPIAAQSFLQYSACVGGESMATHGRVGQGIGKSWARSAKCVQHPTASGLEPWSKASHTVACR